MTNQTQDLEQHALQAASEYAFHFGELPACRLCLACKGKRVRAIGIRYGQWLCRQCADSSDTIDFYDR